MRERGTQVRRARLAEAGDPRPESRPPGGGSFWPALAIAAIIIATAGWTVVAVMVLNDGATITARASDTPDPDEFIDEEPIEASHEFPELEALLPSAADGYTLEKQSWSAGLYGPDDGLTEEIVAALEAAGKTEADLHGATAADADFELDGVVSVYQADGLAPDVIRDAWIADIVASFPEFVTSTVTIGDKTVTRGGEAEGESFWWAYIIEDYLFVIDGGDEDLAARFIGTLSAGPAGEVPPASAAPSPS